MLEIVVCDDDMADLERAVNMLHKIFTSQKIAYHIEKFVSANQMLENISNVDIGILDISMEELNGIKLGRTLKEKFPDVKLVYITSYEEYCMQVINEVHAFSFLCKPLEYDKLETQMLELLDQLPDTGAEKDFYKVTDSNEKEYLSIKLKLRDILYFEYIKRSRKVLIALSDITYEYDCIFEKLVEELQPYDFVVNCRGNLVNLRHIEKIKGFLLQCILQAADIKNVNEMMLYCLEVTFSKIILIFLYYTFINRFVKKSDIPYAKTRYIMYGIILLYNLINMGVIVENFKNGEENYLCAVNMGCIVLADLYLLYFVKMADEKNYYEKQLIALEQQAKVQYEYYLTQTKKYDQTVQILHDVNKHIKAIEGLYGAEQGNTAGEYAAEIRELLKPLIPVQYTENPILNILLTDKESVMREKGISVTIKVDNVNLNFIEPIDITTIFGNLLDNAIEATEKLKGEKYICIKIGSCHKMIVVSIENNCNEVKWRNGFPVSNKGKNGGIGLLNVQNSIKKYDGDLTLKNDGNKFAAELFLNS